MICTHRDIFGVVLVLVMLAGTVVVARNEAESTTEAMQRKYCFLMKQKYKILPGKSFGLLPVAAHSTYLHARCHRFFCEPNDMAGKGVFACVPLASAIAYEANVTATISAAIEGSPSMESPQTPKSNDKNTNTRIATDSRRNKCFAFKDKYKVIPGRSFGNLPTQLHEVFLALHCDEFFCEPHPMAGKGSYDCNPLPRSST